MYILVPFPDNQPFMEYEGYQENSYPVTDDDGLGGASLINASWLMDKNEGAAISHITKSISQLPFSKRDIHIIETEWGQNIPFEGGMTDREALIQIFTNNQQ